MEITVREAARELLRRDNITILCHQKPDGRELRMRQVRNVLNIIFMVVAVVGVGIYLSGNTTTGLYVFIGSMPFKIIELAIRMLKL